MELNQYQELAMRTAKPLETKAEKLLHAALGCGSEVGEFSVNVFKETHFMKSDDHNTVEELGDICWYIAILCDAMEFRFEEVVAYLSDEQFSASMEAVFDSNTFKSLMGRFLVMSYYAGELQTLVKSHVYYGKQLNADAVKHAAAMTVMSTFALARYFATTPSSVLEANINKLAKRYPDKFSAEAAIARADKV